MTTTAATFASALEPLPAELQDEVARHWQTYTTAAQQADVPLPPAALLESLAHVWACSEFVARTCCREPHLLHDLLTSGDLATSRASGDYAGRLANHLADVGNEEALHRELRRFRRREMVRIAWRDLAGGVPLTETLADLSDLAEAAVDQTLRKLYDWHCQRFGTPRDAHGRPQQLVVLGMGKLGGRELNYSSDIDLILTFPQDGVTDGRRSIDNEEFFRRLAQNLVKALNAITADGFVFRVDLRLRPFGDSGPLVLPFSALVDYYQVHGRDWERYALIKARVIAGDPTDGAELLAQLRPFVYRRYLDYGAFEALRGMKALIAKEVERKGLRRNIKLGPGGIREIEFIGQVFQLIYGGREAALRERGIQPVLDYLGASGRLPGEAVAQLQAAYDFLRRVENRLQAWADQQTYNVPTEPLAKRRLAHALGFADWPAFRQALMQHTRRVTNQFEQVFAAPQTESGSAPAALDLATVWRGAVSGDEAIQFLRERGYVDAATVWQWLQDFRQSLSYRSLSQRGRERMDQLLPLLLGAVVAGARDQPDATLDRLLRLLAAVGRRSVYLALLVDHPLALSQLVRLCAASVWISRLLARYPLLLDELLNPATLYHPPARQQLGEDLQNYLVQVPAGDTEELLNGLRHFKQTNVLRVAAADVSDALPLMVVSDHLTEIAEVLLRKVLQLAWADLLPRYGQPVCRVDGVERPAAFAIVAYGKLGGIELNYSSDLDIVFLHDSEGERQQTQGPHELDNPTFFARLVQRIIYWLTTRTGAGELYEVDMRLRPSGRAGLLVSSFEAFAEYQRHEAWTWEHQALVRARVVAGPPALAERFAAIRREVLSRPRDPVLLRREVREMRERMRVELGSGQPGWFDLKQDPGGIADIEFMVQYAVLAYAHAHPELLIYTDNIRQLDGLRDGGVFSGAAVALLQDSYRALRRRLHRQTLQEQSRLIPDDQLREYREGVLELWRQVMEPATDPAADDPGVPTA